MHCKPLRMLLLLAACHSQMTARGEGDGPGAAGTVLSVEGIVEVAKAGDARWVAASTNLHLAFGDTLRTGSRSRAVVRLSDLSVLRVNEKTILEVRPQGGGEGTVLDLNSGSAYLFNRSKPASLRFQTPLISGAIRGTEFNLEAIPQGRTTVVLLDGEVALDNPYGQIVLESGEEGIVDPNQAPRKTAVLNAINHIQWSLYYPGVLDVAELGLAQPASGPLADSISAYVAGDLLRALGKYPE